MLEAGLSEIESRSQVSLLCQERLGVKSYTHILDPHYVVAPDALDGLERDLCRLLRREPIQYILGYAEFYSRRFSVGPGVLIPRPETELLVQGAVDLVRGLIRSETLGSPIRVLDLCCGSGCITWSVALECPSVEAVGIDISETALDYARRQFPTTPRVKFMNSDVLSVESMEGMGKFDVVLSNPPYIMQREKSQMERNVLDYEPDLALFVPDEDPLLFYRAVAVWARNVLKEGGVGMVEINERLGAETLGLFEKEGFRNNLLKKDLGGRDRIVQFAK